MALQNGNDLVLAIHTTSGSEVKFAYSTSTTFDFSNGLLESTNKDSSSFTQFISGRQSGTISTDGLVDFDDVASATATEQFSDYALAGSTVFWKFDLPVTTSLSAGDMTGWSGQAIIDSFSISAASDEIVTYSVNLTLITKPVKTVKV